MGNVLRMNKKQLNEGMVKLGWSDRRIAPETKIDHTTVARYRRAFEIKLQVPTDSSDTNSGIPEHQISLPSNSRATDIVRFLNLNIPFFPSDDSQP